MDVESSLTDYYREGYDRGHTLGLYALDEPGFDHEISPPAPLSGEWAGESIPELFGFTPEDDELDAYEQGYYDGWNVATDPDLPGQDPR